VHRRWVSQDRIKLPMKREPEAQSACQEIRIGVGPRSVIGSALEPIQVSASRTSTSFLRS
jgi:hypothetical protein